MNSTISNASSYLLKLPQELKDNIYKLVLGGNYIHVHADKDEAPQYQLYLCAATVSDTAAQNNFDSAVELPAFKFGPHQSCTLGWWHRTQPAHLSVGLLRSCREVYDEARNVLYTANTLSFQDPKLLCHFIHSSETRGGHNVAIRRLGLHMRISTRKEEQAWHLALRTISQSLTGLLSINISIEQFIWNGSESRRHRPSTGRKKTFLTSVEDLKTLKLNDMTLIVDDLCIPFAKTVVRGMYAGKSDWTHDQKLEWSRMVKAAILGSVD